MCDVPIVGRGGTAVTPSGLTYYLDTPEGHAALAQAEASEAGTAILVPHEGPADGVPPTPQTPTGCDSYSDAQFDTACSQYFKFAHMKMKPSDQLGLTAGDIACNWQKLCQNVLDPILESGRKFNINSGFRTLAYNKTLGNASTTSDHLTGCAADISMGSVEANKALFKYIGQNLNSTFSQIIFEGKWVHVAYNGRSSPSAVVLATRTGAAPYINGGGSSGSALPPDLRWA